MNFLTAISKTWDIAVFVSALLAFTAAMASLAVSIKSGRKRSFIATVTRVRSNYIRELRAVTASFCYLATATPFSQDKLKKTGYKLKLMMNPAMFPEKWDGEAVALIKQIEKRPQPADVHTLLALMQSWLALEWHGMMEEAKKGILPDMEKNRLRNKFYLQYKKHK